MSRFYTIDDVWSYLEQIPMFSAKGASAANFALDNIKQFCNEIGDPQDSFKSIHVAGTNGKGTSCYLLESVYTHAGYTTGMFTSPHLLEYNERVRVNKENISDEHLLEFFQFTENVLEKIELTYFEISTALAFWYFARQKVDIAIIEAGLGGRLDSTNIIQPVASVITSIGFDHQDILGDTLTEIASEKAGIIKHKIPVVTGDLDEEAMEVILQKAESEESEVIKTRSMYPDFENGKITLRNPDLIINSRFIEAVNKWNVAITIAVVNSLEPILPLSKNQLIEAVESFEGVTGRFERLHPDRNWFFSGSHNQQAVDSLMDAVNEFDAERKILVFSMLKDKVKPAILNKFKSFDECYFYEQEGDRAAKLSDLSDYLTIKTLPEDNMSIFLNELDTSLVIFAGSFYFYPTVKRWLAE